MIELITDMTIFDHNAGKGFSVDIVKKEFKKYKLLVDPLYEGDV